MKVAHQYKIIMFTGPPGSEYKWSWKQNMVKEKWNKDAFCARFDAPFFMPSA